MKKPLIVIALCALAACGADGEPIQPKADTSVTLSNHGVAVGTRIGTKHGPFSVYVGKIL